MLRKALITLALLAGSAQAATDLCPAQLPAGAWGLDYQLSGSQDHQAKVELLRSGAQSALYSPERQLAEWWHFDDPKRPRFSRVFAEQQRRIDYYMGDLRALRVKVSQAEVESFATAHLLDQLSPVEGSDCAQAQRYQGEIKGVRYDLLWSPVLKAPLALSTQLGEQKRHWQARALLDDKAVKARFARWQGFMETDYADIGDMESDPFLAKMINQGFIEHSEHAVYNAQGQPMGGGHQH
ncbi:hypothetical protein [Gallaecimonas xiamenensis]|uniref:Lipoprotein n=1 Tax=Gallaecimonas xiamenensis 3-C-1 TaxID=745411 RepID=K2K3S2_9GAMM|nr:hypothetical protein [Gallaecimonas xiamenensis]EKE77589.1 hypothetical protein B3C1_02220 [Gallaecimonas xiamenensis 3-C-1]